MFCRHTTQHVANVVVSAESARSVISRNNEQLAGSRNHENQPVTRNREHLQSQLPQNKRHSFTAVLPINSNHQHHRR